MTDSSKFRGPATQAGMWNAMEVVRNNRRSQEEPIKWVFLVEAEKATINLVQVEKEIRTHIHSEHDEIIYALSADGEFRLGESVRKLKTGDLIYVPAGVPHGLVGADSALLSIYAPYYDSKNPDRVWVEEKK